MSLQERDLDRAWVVSYWGVRCWGVQPLSPEERRSAAILRELEVIHQMMPNWRHACLYKAASQMQFWRNRWRRKLRVLQASPPLPLP